ncbi:NAD(P)-dependent alcohol dehydrogenase [Nesterenkonia halotolerans]|uniref:NAD(P)-dependent alcohol dehydrogenase n=1 Tax=Nesterenkonia halotolerans TaxID=225325 RepID=UPI003EE6D077
MTTTITALQADSAEGDFTRRPLERRSLRADDVRIAIRYAGICHTDIHQVRNEWGGASYPMTPGHEIIGDVVEVGADVSEFTVGDTVGVGCFADSCMECEACKAGEEQFCSQGVVATYNGQDKDGETTHGGYSQQIVVRDHFVLRIPEGMDAASTTPLLCAGITTYAPLKRYGAGPGVKVGVIGMGGLGHIAVKIAAAMGAEVTVLSRTDSKKEDGLSFGATSYRATEDGSAFQELAGTFDLIINTVGASVSLDSFLGLLGRGGTMVNVGAPSEEQSFQMFSLLTMRRNYAGSMVGGLPETQEMLDFCAKHGITATTELIQADQVAEYYDKVVSGDVRYRAVIDIASLENAS